MRKPIDSAIFLAVCTAMLYSWSTANYHGFIRTVNLDADMMARSFHQVIYNGLIVSFGPILLMLFLVTVILFFWSHAILPLYIDYVRGRLKAKRRVIKIRRSWMGKRIAPAIERNEKNRFNRFLLYFVVGFSFILSLIYFDVKGQQQAKDLIEKHTSGENELGSIISVVINENEKSLRNLGCGAKNCAGIEEKSNKTYYFSQSSGYSFVYETKK